VLAMAAPAINGADAQQVTEALGMPASDAFEIARRLLDDPYPEVSAAAAAWTSTPPEQLPEGAAAWLAQLSPSVDRGPIPSQDEADTWAREHTLGLIEQFPIQLHPAMACVLASALATRVSWREPFTAVSSDGFRSDWRTRVSTILRSPSDHQCAIIHHHSAGDVAVHRAIADNLVVTSVIAAEGVPAGTVLDAAYDVECHATDHSSRSLFSLPIGDGHAWTITESPGWERDESLTALLPAWSANSTHDLSDPRLGFAPAAHALVELFGAANDWTAVQSAVARYHRVGFEAAAVTGMDAGGYPRPGLQRNALLRFDRPYAVVATTWDHVRRGGWHVLPVFSAWITEPEEVTD
uniref:hypothetical protein n=1 Tax=Pseudonocardia sp. TRM90224 TaxID=2812678 RepID=UPI001E555399